MAQLRDLNRSLENASDEEAFELIRQVRERRRRAGEAAQAKQRKPREKKIAQDKMLKIAAQFTADDIARFKALIGAS